MNWNSITISHYNIYPLKFIITFFGSRVPPFSRVLLHCIFLILLETYFSIVKSLNLQLILQYNIPLDIFLPLMI